jgi:hypothetical protein
MYWVYESRRTENDDWEGTEMMNSMGRKGWECFKIRQANTNDGYIITTWFKKQVE